MPRQVLLSYCISSYSFGLSSQLAWTHKNFIALAGCRIIVRTHSKGATVYNLCSVQQCSVAFAYVRYTPATSQTVSRHLRPVFCPRMRYGSPGVDVVFYAFQLRQPEDTGLLSLLVYG